MSLFLVEVASVKILVLVNKIQEIFFKFVQFF
jgi:hypothetical protein